MNDNIYFLIYQLSYMIQIGAFLFLFTHVLKKRFSFFVIWGIECAAQLLIGFSCLFFDMSVRIQSILQQMLALTGIMFLFEGKMREKIACFVGLDFISIFVSLISALFIKMVCEIDVSILGNEGVWNALSALLTSDILMAVIFSICWIVLHKKHNKNNTAFVKSQLRIFLLIMIVHYGFLIVHYSKITEIDDFDLLMNYIFQVIIILLLYLQYFAVCKNIDLLEENYLFSMKQSEQENEKRYYELAQAKFDDISKIRHDLNNHLGIAKHLILDDRKNEAQEIIEDICKTLDEIKAVQYCSNPLINTILTTKANEQAYKTIDMQFVMKDCDRIPCDAAELCSLFSNLFDNAAKAALESDGDPVLRMESGIVNEFFVLKVTNTAKNGAVPAGIHTISTKNESGHGYGLSIIAMIAKKYQGNFFLNQEEEFVTGTVMLKHL